MKILLVLPAAEHVRVTPDNPHVPRRRMLRFSVLPLTIVAALTPRRHEVRLIDENVEPLDLEADVDLVGITFMTALAPRAYEIADAFRRRGIATVAGGYHPTFLPQEALAHFDAVVVGEAEGAWPRLLADLEQGRLGKLYGGDGPCDPTMIPIPRRDLTARTARHYATVHAVQAGRGCVHGCRYCSVTAFHHRSYRSRPIENVLAEIREVPRHFMFVDDNLVADRAYAARLFRQMLPLRKRWVAQASLELADDPELVDLASRAGCVGLFVGIETFSARNLAAVEKDFNDRRSYRRRLAVLHRHGIGVIAGVIVGMDGDGPDVFARTLRFLEELHIDAVQVNVMTPLPGTPLFERFDGSGRILDRDWSRFDFRHVVIRPARMTPGQLQAGADWLYARFFRLDRIVIRFARALVTLGPLPAWLGLKLGLTYRYDNRHQGIVGRNPALDEKEALPCFG